MMTTKSPSSSSTINRWKTIRARARAGEADDSTADPLRAGGSKRLILKTRRSLAKSGGAELAFTGFPLANAREQSGYIGITQSPNLWIDTAAPQGLYRIDPSKLPSDLRARPSTTLAYEFRHQPFLLDLGVELSPPQIRGESRTFFQIDRDQARSETTIELAWVRAALDLALGIAPGLQVVSVGPADVCRELTRRRNHSAGSPAQYPTHARSQAAEQGHAQAHRDRADRDARLDEARAYSHLIGRLRSIRSTRLGRRGLACELDDETGKLRRAPELKSRFQNPSADWMGVFLPKVAVSQPMFLVDDGEFQVPADPAHAPDPSTPPRNGADREVSARSVDVLERTTLTVRHGTLSSLVIQVPAPFADRWELVRATGC